MHHMKTITVRDLRYHFPRVEAFIAEREEILLTRRKRVIARILPPELSKPKRKRPDFLARIRRIYGEKLLKVSGAELLREERERF